MVQIPGLSSLLSLPCTPWCGRRMHGVSILFPAPARPRACVPHRRPGTTPRPYSFSAARAAISGAAASLLAGNANLARLATPYQMMMTTMMVGSIPAHSRSGKLCDRSSHTHRTVRLIKAPMYVVLFFAFAVACGRRRRSSVLWETHPRTGSSARSATGHVLGWVWSGGRETAGGPRGDDGGGTARRCGQLAIDPISQWFRPRPVGATEAGAALRTTRSSPHLRRTNLQEIKD